MKSYFVQILMEVEAETPAGAARAAVDSIVKLKEPWVTVDVREWDENGIVDETSLETYDIYL